MPNEFEFDGAEALATALADSVAGSLRSAIAERGQATLVVGGGRTPARFFAALSARVLDWPAVWVSLTDERWVDSDHADSNEALARRHLLRNQAAPARWVGLKNTAATPFEGEIECELAITALPRPFDVVVLGMGDDGHTASWFPRAPQLAQALDIDSRRLCIGIAPLSAPHPRITLTLSALLASRRIVIMFTGAGKHEVYRRALRPGAVEALPIRAVLRQTRAPVDVYCSP